MTYPRAASSLVRIPIARWCLALLGVLLSTSSAEAKTHDIPETLRCETDRVHLAERSTSKKDASRVHLAKRSPPKKGASRISIQKKREIEIVAHANAAANLVAAGKFAQAAQRFESGLKLARELAPLDVNKVVVVGSKPTSLGVYRPAENGRIYARALRLYVEVKNFAHQEISTNKGEEKIWEVNLEVTGVFFLGDGQELGQKSLGTHRFETRTRTGHTWLGLDVQLGDTVPNGTYDIEIEVFDRVSKKKSSRRVSFTI